MSYRLPTRTIAAATCSSAGCDTTASHREGDLGGFDDAFRGWAMGPADSRCPQHAVRVALVA